MNLILQYVPWYVVAAFASAAPVGWYAINALEYGLNSGQLGRGKWWVFECFWEELLQNLPGGLERKVEKLKQMVGPYHPRVDGVFCSGSGSWRYNDLREHGGWEECARAMFGGPVYFWLVKVGAYSIVGLAIGLPVLIAYVSHFASRAFAR